MKCPYIENRKSKEEAVYEYDENGMQTKMTVTSWDVACPTECMKEECAAWQNDSCKFCLIQT